MLPISIKFHQPAPLKGNSSTSNGNGTAGLSDEQIRSLGAPKRINPILWDLSNPQERRELMNNAAVEDQAVSDTPSIESNQNSLNNLSSTQPQQFYSQQKALGQSSNTPTNTADSNSPTRSAGTLQETNAALRQAIAKKSSANEQQNLQQVKQQFQQRFSETAQDKSSFHNIMKKTFGDQYDQGKAETIRQQTLKGDFSWMPDIKLVDGNQLSDISGTQNGGVGLGAYSKDTDTVYLSRDLLNTNKAEAEKILTEEVGHAIDTRINVNDAKGDEGDIFARYLQGESISSEKLAELKQENDSGTIEIDGKKIEIEFGLRSKLKKAVKRVAKGVKKAAKGVAKGVKKAVKGVAKGFKKAVKGVAKGFKKVVKGIKKVVKGVAKGIKKAAKKLMQSKVFQAILTVAQFVPIPVVALVARGINMAMSAYNVYQGIKHKSWGMVLGGVAGVAGGVSDFGKAIGASANFVNKAATFAKYAGNASMAYKAIAEKDFSTVANLAANYFGGNSKVATTLQQAATANQVYSSIKEGNYLNAIGVGSSLMQEFTGEGGDKILQSIGQNANILQGIDQAVRNGNYDSAVSILTNNYGSNLNLSKEASAKINNVVEAFQKAHQANQMIKSHNYADAAQLLLEAAQQNTSNPETKQRLIETSQSIQKIDDVMSAIKQGRYEEGISTAGDLLGKPLDNQSRKILTDLQKYAEQSKHLANLLESGAPKEIIEEVKRILEENTVIYNLNNQIDVAA